VRKARNLERAGVSETDDASEATDNTLKTDRAVKPALPKRGAKKTAPAKVRSGWPGEWKSGSRW